MSGNVGKLNVILGGNVMGLINSMKKAQASLRTVREEMRNISAGATRMTLVFGAATAGAAVAFAKFEKELTRATAISSVQMKQIEGSGRDAQKSFAHDFGRMEKTALGLSTSTEYTATQVGAAMSKLAMSGMNTSAVIAVIPTVTSVASAGMVDLATSADIVTNVMAGFGITLQKLEEDLGDANVATKVLENETRKAGDVLVAVFTGANTTLEELGQAFKTGGPTAKLFGVQIEEVGAALGVLANAGIKGTDAGTGLKRALTALSKPSKEAAKAMKRLGLRSTDVADHGIAAVVSQLEHARKVYTKFGRETEFVGDLIQLFGQRAGPKMAALVEQGAVAIDKLMKRAIVAQKMKIGDLAPDLAEALGLDGVDPNEMVGLSKFLELQQLKTLAGQFNILKSAIAEFGIEIGKALKVYLAPIVVKLRDLFKAASNASPAVKKLIAAVLIIGTAGAAAVAVIAHIAAAFTTMALSIGAIVFAAPKIMGFFSAAAGPVIVIGIALAAAALAAGLFADEIITAGKWWAKTIKEIWSSADGFGVALAATFIAVGDQIKVSLGKIASALVEMLYLPIKVALKYNDLLMVPLVKVFETIMDVTIKAMRMLRDAVQAFPHIADSLGLDPKRVDQFVHSLVGGLNDAKATVRSFADLESQANDFIANVRGLFVVEPMSDEEIMELAEDLPGAISHMFEKAAAGWKKLLDATFGDPLKAGEDFEKMLDGIADKFKGLARPVNPDAFRGDGKGKTRAEILGERSDDLGGLVSEISSELSKITGMISESPHLAKKMLEELATSAGIADGGLKELGKRLENEAARSYSELTEKMKHAADSVGIATAKRKALVAQTEKLSEAVKKTAAASKAAPLDKSLTDAASRAKEEFDKMSSKTREATNALEAARARFAGLSERRDDVQDQLNNQIPKTRQAIADLDDAFAKAVGKATQAIRTQHLQRVESAVGEATKILNQIPATSGFSGLAMIGEILGALENIDVKGSAKHANMIQEAMKVAADKANLIKASMAAAVIDLVRQLGAGVMSGSPSQVAGGLGTAIGIGIGKAVGALSGTPETGDMIGQALGSLLGEFASGVIRALEATEEFAEFMEDVAYTFEKIFTEFAPVAEAFIAAIRPAFGMMAALAEEIAPLLTAFFGLRVVTEILFEGVKSIALLLYAIVAIFQSAALLLEGINNAFAKVFGGVSLIAVLFNIVNAVILGVAVTIIEGIAIVASVLVEAGRIIAGVLMIFINPFVGIAMILDGLWNVFMDIWIAMLSIANAVTLGAFSDQLNAAMEAARNTQGSNIEDFVRSTDMGARTADFGMGDMFNGMRGLVDAIRDTEGGLFDLIDVTGDLASAKIDEKEATEDLREQLTNVPEGFKVALARFDAIDPTAPGFTQIGTGERGIEVSEAGLTVIMENVNITAENDQQLFEAIRRQAERTERRTGGPLTHSRMR